jgi:hypothetical protein
MHKYLIGIGDSFTSGQGSVSRKFHEKWGDKVYHHDTRIPSIDIEESENSWVTHLANKLGYTPLNLGSKGRGNRSAAKELYMNQIDPENEKIVVFCLSSMSRFDFVMKDFLIQYDHFSPIFPDMNGNKLWQGYAECGNSNQQEAVDCLLNIAEVQNWCKVNNAKLLLVSAFDSNINQQSISERIQVEDKRYLTDIVDWDLFFRPRGNKTMMELLVREQESGLEEHQLQPIYEFDYFNRYKKEGFAEGLITPCGHPSNTGHMFLSDVLADEIRGRGYVNQGE